ncbi:MAG TPA: carbon storage regulator [Lacipirellulaceae bacterium]|nr:carbon storage regulator [Lacipirellulaceae bacterium]
MLVLTRKQGEKIRIGDDVVITVVRTKGKAVRLGIQAPAHVPVLRGEIAAAMAAESHRHGESLSADLASGESDPEGGRLRAASLCCARALGVAGRGPLAAMVEGRC